MSTQETLLFQLQGSPTCMTEHQGRPCASEDSRHSLAFPQPNVLGLGLAFLVPIEQKPALLVL